MQLGRDGFNHSSLRTVPPPAVQVQLGRDGFNDSARLRIMESARRGPALYHAPTQMPAYAPALEAWEAATAADLEDSGGGGVRRVGDITVATAGMDSAAAGACHVGDSNDGGSSCAFPDPGSGTEGGGTASGTAATAASGLPPRGTAAGRTRTVPGGEGVRRAWAAAVAAYGFRLHPELVKALEQRRHASWPLRAGGSFGASCPCAAAATAVTAPANAFGAELVGLLALASSAENCIATALVVVPGDHMMFALVRFFPLPQRNMLYLFIHFTTPSSPPQFRANPPSRCVGHPCAPR